MNGIAALVASLLVQGAVVRAAPTSRQAGVDARGHVSLWQGPASRGSEAMLRREPQPLGLARLHTLDDTGGLSQQDCKPIAVNPTEKHREYSSQMVLTHGLKSFYKNSVLDSNDGGGAWCAAANKDGEWVEIDLHKSYRVKGTIIQGALGPDAWVTEYKVSYSTDRKSWHDADGTFSGNSDFFTHVKNDFKRPVRARFVRFYPKKWHTDLCMRAALEVCEASAVDLPQKHKAIKTSKPDTGTSEEDPFKRLEEQANASEHSEHHKQHEEADGNTSAIDCSWHEWESWSLCTSSCGGTGVRRRERDVLVYPQNHGRNCEGDHHEEEGCNRVPCPLAESHEEGESRHHSTIVVVPVPAPAVPVEHERVVVVPKPVPAPATAPAPAVQAVVVPVAMAASTTPVVPPEPLPLPPSRREVEDGPPSRRGIYGEG